jgi:hypothetical protein
VRRDSAFGPRGSDSLLVAVRIGLVVLMLFLGYVVFFSKPANSRIVFPFLHFTNAGAGYEAVFTVSNHPGSGSVELKSARIEERTASGWKLVASNARFAPGRWIRVPVSATNIPLRVVFHGEERRDDPFSVFYRDLLERIYPNSTHSIHWHSFSVTNDAVGHAQ